MFKNICLTFFSVLSIISLSANVNAEVKCVDKYGSSYKKELPTDTTGDIIRQDTPLITPKGKLECNILSNKKYKVERGSINNIMYSVYYFDGSGSVQGLKTNTLDAKDEYGTNWKTSCKKDEMDDSRWCTLDKRNNLRVGIWKDGTSFVSIGYEHYPDSNVTIRIDKGKPITISEKLSFTTAQSDDIINALKSGKSVLTRYQKWPYKRNIDTPIDLYGFTEAWSILNSIFNASVKEMDNAQAAETTYEKGDYKTAIKQWKILAEQGDASAQNTLGSMYAKGQGVPQDDQEAVKWFRLAAEQGLAKAQNSLSGMYQYGRGVRQDDQEAAKWTRLAAEQGFASAQYNLGLRYSNGQGAPQDDQEAVKWYRLAAEQGFPEAQFNLGVGYRDGQGVPQDDQEAVKWFRLAAEQGFALAQYNLGVMYREGKGVPQDDQEAVKWTRLAAEQGYAGAQNNLGLMYAKGQGVPQDYVSAHMWFNLAGSKGDKDAIKSRNRAEELMSQPKIEKAQKMARDWKLSNK